MAKPKRRNPIGKEGEGREIWFTNDRYYNSLSNGDF